MSSNKKGDRNERLLITWMDENSWAVMRAPASGSSTDRELPDIIAGNGQRFLAIEVKSSSGDPIYLDGEEIDALRYFAENFGADAYVAVKFDLERGDPAYGEDRPGFYFIHIDALYQTEGGNYRVKKETAHEHGIPEVRL